MEIIGRLDIVSRPASAYSFLHCFGTCINIILPQAGGRNVIDIHRQVSSLLAPLTLTSRASRFQTQ